MTNDPTARALQLLSLLQTHQFWPGAELAERLDVSSRTLRRDVDRLRELGYPVDATPGVAGGYRLGAGAHMPPLVLDDDEAVAIAVGLRAAAGASVDGIEDTSVRALAKLEQLLPDRLRRRVSAVHTNVMSLRWGTPGPTVDSEALAVTAQACRDHEQLRFDYQRRDGDDTRRLVEPCQLVSAGRRWYLVAYDVRRQAWRTFRMDRLRKPAPAGIRFAPRSLPAADAATFVAESITARPKAHEATLIAQGPASAVRDAIRWIDAKVDAAGERTSRVHLKADSVDDLVLAVAVLALAFEVDLTTSDDVVTGVTQLADRLRTASSPLPVCR
ncbi:MAG: YafY family transcriptional regulator [Actinomycetota bacterium]|nr:YafY family transcriptional regulator [Actinomycetota bacterium]